MDNKRIKRNRCKCLKCGEVIESKHRHDFVRCKCKEIFTDGGLAYLHRGAKNPGYILDLSEYEEEDNVG